MKVRDKQSFSSFQFFKKVYSLKLCSVWKQCLTWWHCTQLLSWHIVCHVNFIIWIFFGTVFTQSCFCFTEATTLHELYLAFFQSCVNFNFRQTSLLFIKCNKEVRALDRRLSVLHSVRKTVNHVLTWKNVSLVQAAIRHVCSYEEPGILGFSTDDFFFF